jgi:hypothetical protein
VCRFEVTRALCQLERTTRVQLHTPSVPVRDRESVAPVADAGVTRQRVELSRTSEICLNPVAERTHQGEAAAALRLLGVARFAIERDGVNVVLDHADAGLVMLTDLVAGDHVAAIARSLIVRVAVQH